MLTLHAGALAGPRLYGSIKQLSTLSSMYESPVSCDYACLRLPRWWILAGLTLIYIPMFLWGTALVSGIRFGSFQWPILFFCCAYCISPSLGLSVINNTVLGFRIAALLCDRSCLRLLFLLSLAGTLCTGWRIVIAFLTIFGKEYGRVL